ncbi:MAG: hypothetical protein AAF389_06415 [Gemmatimonadota bacterium]
MSPSSRGIVAGLFMAGVAALFTLSANQGWLLPSLDEDGAELLAGVPAIHGVDGTLWADGPRSVSEEWDGVDRYPLAGQGVAMAATMAGLLAVRPQPHVTALWTLAGSAALLMLFLGWAVGGAAGIHGALLAGAMLGGSTVTVGLATSLRPELMAMALVAFQLGLFAYQPRWSFAHGFVGVLTLLVHPAGWGALAAAVGIAWIGRDSRNDAKRATAAAGAPVVVLVLAVALIPWATASAVLPSEAGLTSALTVVAGVATFLGGGWGLPSMIVGPVVGVGALVLVLVEWVDTPAVFEAVEWNDPRAPDALAEHLRVGALAQIGALLLAGVLVGDSATGLGRAGALAVVPLVALAATASARHLVRVRGRSVVSIVLAAWAAVSIVSAGQALERIKEDGRGLTHRRWVSSEVIRWVDNRSSGVPAFYSDEPALLYVQSGEHGIRLPTHPSDVPDFAAAFAARPGALVVTDASPIPATEYARALDLAVAVESAEGMVLLPVR